MLVVNRRMAVSWPHQGGQAMAVGNMAVEEIISARRREKDGHKSSRSGEVEMAMGWQNDLLQFGTATSWPFQSWLYTPNYSQLVTYIFFCGDSFPFLSHFPQIVQLDRSGDILAGDKIIVPSW